MCMELVNCDEKYWEFVRKLRSDKENSKGFIEQVNITEEQQIKYMTKNADWFKICLIDNEPVGYIGLIGDDRSEITYCSDVKGKGVGTFMVSEILKSSDKIWAKVLKDNVASIKVFEKFNLNQEETDKFIIYTQ